MTGSQRIGMFGAQKDDLPAIWRKRSPPVLKPATRMPRRCAWRKTCVGSTRCRYGVGDSVGFGVTLEHRYAAASAPRTK